jgi:predicted transposase YbfD/YdcC
VFGRLKPKPFRDAFFAWAKALQAATTDEQGSVAIDGKALRAAMKRSTDKSNLTFVSAVATDGHLVLGVVKAADKSNEITAIPQLLAMLDLRKAHVTIDAAGTQTAIAEQIVNGGGDYTLALKGNQGTTFQAVSKTLTDLALDGFKNTTSKAHSTSEIGHGRSEERSSSRTATSYRSVSSVTNSTSCDGTIRRADNIPQMVLSSPRVSNRYVTRGRPRPAARCERASCFGTT